MPSLKDVPLSKLTLQRVQQFLNDKLKAGKLAFPRTLSQVVLRLPLSEAVKSDLLPRNVAALATPPKVERQEVVPFTPEQAGRFMKAELGHGLEALFASALAVGLRSGNPAARLNYRLPASRHYARTRNVRTRSGSLRARDGMTPNTFSRAQLGRPSTTARS